MHMLLSLYLKNGEFVYELLIDLRRIREIIRQAERQRHSEKKLLSENNEDNYKSLT